MIDTRQRLLAATRQCLGRNGLAATTSRDITGAAGANLSAITYYFGSKEELVAAALLEDLGAWLMPAIDVLAGEGEPGERMMTAVQTLVASYEQHREDAPVHLEALLQAPRMDALRLTLVGLWRDLRRLLADQMTEMQIHGQLPRWVEPESMAGLFTALANGLVLQVTIDAEGPELQAMAGQFGALLLAVRA